jgi:hypothetical protein
MPRQSGQRRRTVQGDDGQHQDDPTDEQAPLDKLWANEAKRTRRRQRTRKALEVTLDVVQEISNFWP